VPSRLPLTLDYPINNLSVVAHSRATLVRTMDKLKEITLQLCDEDDDPRGCPDVTRAICRCTIQKELADIADAIQMGKSCVIWILEGHDLEVESAPLPEVHPLAGLVPPNDEQLRGTGKVRFKVRVSESMMEDETIENNARIVFDTSSGEATLPTNFTVGYRFRRGDANDDGSANLSDALNILNHLFSGADAPECIDAADANDDGEMNITDPLAILNFLFLGTGELPAPGPHECGFDFTLDVDPITQLETYNLGCNPGRCALERRLREATGSP
jgi:Dockerin type I domain